MKNIIASLLVMLCVNCLHAQQASLPNFLQGNYMDDYGIRYTINDSVWIQLPKTKYHIVKLDPQHQFIIAKNDTANKSDQGLYTRIDFMAFENMAPYTWGFCLTAYDAATLMDAENTASADRKNPKKGCGGYPFSRMKK